MWECSDMSQAVNKHQPLNQGRKAGDIGDLTPGLSEAAGPLGWTWMVPSVHTF